MLPWGEYWRLKASPQNVENNKIYSYLAFYSWDLYFKVVVEDPFVSYELDRLIEASSASAGVLDIIAASGTRTLTQQDLDVSTGGALEVNWITKC